jgi:hypothetical protein
VLRAPLGARGGANVGHHRFVKVTLSLDVLDPADPPATTPDDQITTDLATALTNFKPKIKGKDSKIKNVTVT